MTFGGANFVFASPKQFCLWVTVPIRLLSGALIERQVKHLCQMQSAAFCQLRNLLLAAEAIGDNQSLRIRFPYCRQKHALADRKSTRLNSSHVSISYAVFCLK